MKAIRFTYKAYSVALITLAAGIFLSIKLNDWSWFSRTGSLVVVNGIILTSHQIIEHMHHLDRRRVGESQFQRDWARESKHELIHDDNFKLWMNERQGLYMLVAGTLVWGFGDLIGLL